jgi:PAS domain S-box-containing protein
MVRPGWFPRSTFGRIVHQAGLWGVYFLLAALCLRLAVPGTNASVIWVPTGLAIAAVLFYGPGVWPSIFLGAFSVNYWLLSGMGLPTVVMVGACLITAAGNAGEALLAGFLVRRWTRTRLPLDRVSHVLVFILAAGVLGPALSAVAGTTSFCGATGRWFLFKSMGVAWWMGDAVAAMVVTPLLLSLQKVDLAAIPFKIHRDAFLAGALTLAFWFGVCPMLPPLAFLFFPLLVLGTSRLGQFYGVALVLLLAFLATTSTLWGMGPFVLPGTQSHSLLFQQGFIATLAITTLVLASAFEERNALGLRLNVQNRLYKTLSDANQAFVHAGDRVDLLASTCRILVDVGGFAIAWVGVKDASGSIVPEASAGAGSSGAWDGALPWSSFAEGQKWIDAVIQEQKQIVINESKDDPEGDARAPQGTGRFRTCCAFPIHQVSTASRVLVVFHQDANAIDAGDLHLMKELTDDLGYAIDALETRMELAESERRLRTTLANVKLLAVTLEADARIGTCNDFMLSLTGWSLEEVLGRDYFDLFVPPEARQEVRRILAFVPESEDLEPYHENEILTRSGGRRLVRWNNTLLRDREGCPSGSMCLGEDITDQRKAEADLIKRSNQLVALNALMAHLGTTLELNACCQAAVDECLEASGAKDVMLFLCEGGAMPLMTLASRGPAPEIGRIQTLAEPLCSKVAGSGEPLYLLGTDEGMPIPEEERRRTGIESLAALPLKHGDELLGVLGFTSSSRRGFSRQAAFMEAIAGQVSVGLQNALLHQRVKAHATELEHCVDERTAMLREANEDLVQAVEHARAADRAKSAFLSAMSHELRTPLNSVIGFTGVLLMGIAGKLQAKQEEALRIVQRNGRHLLDLINDVLDLSKIEAAEMNLAAKPYDLVQVLRESIESLTPAAANKGLLLEHDFSTESLLLAGDCRRVAQIVLNLLSNAVKFTETGSVTVHLSVDRHGVNVAVQDTGPGIQPQDLPRLFREFEQLDAGLARRNEGTGLGLALSRRLARLMNGDITVESRPNQGSTFHLLLPVQE